MNNRFKFRAWNKEKNIMCFNNEDDSASYWDGVVASSVGILNSQFKINRYVFMQFTGLMDKNGKEIYESDVVSISETASSDAEYPLQKIMRGADIVLHNYTGVITWDEEGADYSCVCHGETIEDAVGFPRHKQVVEVIGNIYENPELLTNNA